jgi:hypothetical protein
MEDPSETCDSTSEESSSRSESVTGAIHYPTFAKCDKRDLDSGKSSNIDGTKSLVTPSNFKARTLFYPTMDMSQTLESDIEEFVSALFWVLESKRLDKLG